MMNERCRKCLQMLKVHNYNYYNNYFTFVRLLHVHVVLSVYYKCMYVYSIDVIIITATGTLFPLYSINTDCTVIANNIIR